MGRREKIAGKFGKIEHEAGKILPLPIVITGGLIILKLYDAAFWTTILSFIMWAIYRTAHLIEKAFYGKRLRR